MPLVNLVDPVNLEKHYIDETRKLTTCSNL
jgi:hypothetical protein